MVGVSCSDRNKDKNSRVSVKNKGSDSSIGSRILLVTGVIRKVGVNLLINLTNRVILESVAFPGLAGN